MNLYPRLLGAAWPRLDEAIRYAHAGQGVCGRGLLRVEHGTHPLVRLLARLLRLPAPATAIETRLVVTPVADGERWVRYFGDEQLVTRQSRAGAVLVERVRMVELAFDLMTSEGGLIYRQSGAALVAGRLRVRLPRPLAPEVSAREDPAGGRRTRLAVRVTLPLVGLLLAYDGTVEFDERRA